MHLQWTSSTHTYPLTCADLHMIALRSQRCSVCTQKGHSVMYYVHMWTRSMLLWHQGQGPAEIDKKIIRTSLQCLETLCRVHCSTQAPGLGFAYLKWYKCTSRCQYLPLAQLEHGVTLNFIKTFRSLCFTHIQIVFLFKCLNKTILRDFRLTESLFIKVRTSFYVVAVIFSAVSG